MQLSGPGWPYQQLARDVIRRIRSGEFPPGTRLPSLRALAHEYDTTQTTAGKAISELSSLGYLLPSRAGGAFVADALPSDEPTAPGDVHALAARVGQLEAHVTALTERVAELEDHKSR
ncbi:winged helix-turn-helix domain-containing protein [Crossiella sp. CA198]|uniref:winged helix-turn-helix domain-containing protein n=1 Tax=Crossiella sp. CA198 TaxID=3455607 RepID=UPI003F8D6074